LAAIFEPIMTRISGPADFARAFDVSRGTLDRLESYVRLLEQWQAKINLVAPGTLSDVWHRHFADSAQLVGLAPSGARTWLDLGSGAGFPGLVAAVLLAEGGAGRVTLCESDTRKAAFLADVKRKLGLAVDIIASRIEIDSTHASVGRVDVVSARALAPLQRLVPLAAPFFHEQTVGLFLKGREADKEIVEAAKAWSFDFELKPSMTDREGRVAVIRNPVAKRGD
jgi:16S rRNA (guanine527-N7)-methyltransferase